VYLHVAEQPSHVKREVIQDPRWKERQKQQSPTGISEQDDSLQNSLTSEEGLHLQVPLSGGEQDEKVPFNKIPIAVEKEMGQQSLCIS
jgi:hypothetical protein